jgi:hypothetical protein
MKSNDLVFRLRKRAEIRKQITTRKSVQNNEPDRIADLLEEAATALEQDLDTTNKPVAWIAVGDNTSVFFDLDCALSIDDNPTPLYTHPSEHDLGIADAIGFERGYKAATVKELTDEEIINAWNEEWIVLGRDEKFIKFARAILRKAQENG